MGAARASALGMLEDTGAQMHCSEQQDVYYGMLMVALGNCARLHVPASLLT